MTKIYCDRCRNEITDKTKKCIEFAPLEENHKLREYCLDCYREIIKFASKKLIYKKGTSKLYVLGTEIKD